MKPISLKLRLFAASIASIILALFIAGIAIAALFSNHVETNLKNDLVAQFDRLVSLVDPQSSPLALKSPLADPAFSTPYGGLYWQITDVKTKERIRSRSMWDEEFNDVAEEFFDGSFQITQIIDPEGTPAFALVQRLQFELGDGNSRALDIIMAEDLNHFYLANAKFKEELARSLLLLALILSIAAWVQIILGLSPLSKIKKEVNAIKSNSAKRLSNKHPPEVKPLINEVNDLLDSQDISMEFARTRADNLAHSLKTALTILTTEAERLKKDNVKSATIIEQTTNDMKTIIDHQLRLARLKNRTNADNFSTSASHSIQKVVKAIKLTPNGISKQWHLKIDNFFVNIDRADLLELLGIIIENSSQWAKENIFISAISDKKHAIITIEDDGIGVPEKNMKLLGSRGLRLDSKGMGTGIGLSIASEIIVKNSGEITFSNSEKKGLKVTLKLPLANEKKS